MADVELPDTEELEEIKKDSFSKRVALVTAIYAVMLAITSLGGGNAMKDMLLAQQQSSDQWAFYQSKVMREHLYKLQKTQFETNLLERRSSMRPEIVKHYEDLIRTASAEQTRYGNEKKQIEAEAKKQEKERDTNRTKDPYFDYAEVLLQISIVMSSISILASSRQIFIGSICSAFAGVVLSLNGFLLIFRIPFFH